MEHFLASVERRAYRMAEIATGGREEALDLVQDAMFSMVQRYATKPEEEWRTLFFRILQNKIRDWYRRTAVRTRWRVWLGFGNEREAPDPGNPIDRLADPAGRDPEKNCANDAAGRALETALRSLPLRQQQAFLLRAWEGLSINETAAAMNCSAGSVKTHYARALKTLRELLTEHWP